MKWADVEQGSLTVHLGEDPYDDDAEYKKNTLSNGERQDETSNLKIANEKKNQLLIDLLLIGGGRSLRGRCNGTVAISVSK